MQAFLAGFLLLFQRRHQLQNRCSVRRPLSLSVCRLKTSRQIPDSGLPAISVLSQFGKSPPDTGAPSGDYVTTRSDGTISISAMNSYMDDQIPLIIAIGRYSGEVRKSGLTNVVYAVD